MPKPGDLINTKSLISSTELSQPCSITVGIQKTKKQKLPKVIAIKSIFRIPINNIRYLKDIGYVSQIKYPNFYTTINFLIPSLNEIKKTSDINLNLLVRELEFNGNGYIFYPHAFSRFNQKKKMGTNSIFRAIKQFCSKSYNFNSIT